MSNKDITFDFEYLDVNGAKVDMKWDDSIQAYRIIIKIQGDGKKLEMGITSNMVNWEETNLIVDNYKIEK